MNVEGSHWLHHGVPVPRYAKQSITCLLGYVDEETVDHRVNFRSSLSFVLLHAHIDFKGHAHIETCLTL